jgi:hypothetical protein
MYKNVFIPISIVISCLFLTLIVLTCISDAQTKLLECDSNWTDCSGVPWIRDSSYGYNDSCSLRSGPIEVMGLSGICRNFQGPGEIKFMWRTDTSSKLGTMAFFVDGIKRNECNSNNWINANYSFRSDKIYFLEWRFIKISTDRWKGHGWLDDIILLPSDVEKNNPQEKESGPFTPIKEPPYNNTTIIIARAEKGISKPEELVFPSIQQAINSIKEKGRVLVFKGDYEENIIINRSIELIGFYNSTLKYKHYENATIQITSNDTLISGLTIIGGTECINASTYNIKNIIIKNNNLKANSSVIVLKGFSDWYLINNTINIDLPRQSKNCVDLDEIPENPKDHIYDNKLYNSRRGVFAPKCPSNISINFTDLIKPQCLNGIYEEVKYED